MIDFTANDRIDLRAFNKNEFGEIGWQPTKGVKSIWISRYPIENCAQLNIDMDKDGLADLSIRLLGRNSKEFFDNRATYILYGGFS